MFDRYFTRLVFWLVPLPTRRLVDVNAIPLALRNLSDEELQELQSFGGLMASEVLSRTSQIETKAAITFGYAGALVAFLLNLLRWGAPLGQYMICAIAVGLAVLAASLAAHTLLARTGWAWPSEADWFPEKAFGNLNAVRRRHLDSLLYSHQNQAHTADIKGIEVLWAQRFLLLAFIALVVLFVLAWNPPPRILALNNLIWLPT